MAMSPNAVVMMPNQKRVRRNPKHQFQIRQKPYAITPFLIAPVLPHETLDNLLVQARVVTDPIKNPLVGWWYEQYYFYVKHRDLAIRDELVEMVLDPTYDMSANYSVSNVKHYHYSQNTVTGDAVDWVAECLDRVVDEYFRDEDEAVNIVTIDGYPAAKIKQNGIYDSLVMDSAMPATPTIGGSNPQDLEVAMNTWEFMRMNKLTEMDYEDFLRSYGVRGRAVEDPHKPELIRFIRDWSYPTNTVDPTDGDPSSAVSWVVAERADKARYFPEPGFIFGVSVARPKVYLSGQAGAAVAAMDSAFKWLPAIMRAEPASALREYASGKGPFGSAISGGYWIDVRDLLIYGDQFVNYATSDTDSNFISLPNSDGTKKYPTEADVDSLFESTSFELVRSDGVVSLSIRGSEVDQS